MQYVCDILSHISQGPVDLPSRRVFRLYSFCATMGPFQTLLDKIGDHPQQIKDIFLKKCINALIVNASQMMHNSGYGPVQVVSFYPITLSMHRDDMLWKNNHVAKQCFLHWLGQPSDIMSVWLPIHDMICVSKSTNLLNTLCPALFTLYPFAQPEAER